MTRVLVIGGNGYIGSALSTYLAAAGCTVQSWDTCWFGDHTAIDNARADYGTILADHLSSWETIVLAAGHSGVDMCTDRQAAFGVAGGAAIRSCRWSWIPSRCSRTISGSLIAACASQGCKLVAYGASAKANTMLNHWTDVTPSYAVDDNPLKCGRYTPGRGIPILPSSALEHEPGRLAILLTAWNFAEEIQERLRARGRRGDVLLTHTPVVKAETLR